MFEKTYFFYGKHAAMVNKLTAKLTDEIGTAIFGANHLVYRIAPFIGLTYNRKSKIDKSTEDTTRINESQMVRNQQFYIYNYRNIMMTVFKEKPIKERMDIAFRLDYKDEERKPYDEIYNEYVLGGVEVLYEKIFEKDNAKTVDEYLSNLYEFLEDYHERCYSA